MNFHKFANQFKPSQHLIQSVITCVLLGALLACSRPDRPPAVQTPISPREATEPPISTPISDTPPTDEQPGQRSYIDTHMHLDGRSGRGGTLPGNYETAAENLIALMDQYGIAKSVIVVVPTHTGQSAQMDYERIRDSVGKHPDRLYFMGGGAILNPIIQGTDPSAVTPELEQSFKEQAEKFIEEGAQGFGEMLALHLCLSETHSYMVALPDHPLFLLLADVAASHDVPIDLHMEAVPQDMPMPSNLTRACDQNPSVLLATIPPFERFLAHNRDTKIVWQHIGWDNTGYMTVDLVQRLLEAHPNLYLALKVEDRPFQVGSGGEPMPNRIIDENGKIYPEWLNLIQDYPDRFVIGADEFIGASGRAVHGAPSFSQTWDVLDQLPPDLAELVGRENAARIYNLD